MKTAEAKITSTAGHLQQKMNGPFFNKGREGSFFSKSNEASQSFFKSPTIQPKLTIGQTNDKYEQEADDMADKVVQRLSEPQTIQAKPFSSQNVIIPFVQKKCAHCEEEEKKFQKKEKEGTVKEQLQKKPIFESNAKSPEDDKNIQRKCADCEKEEKLQKKSDSNQTASSNIESSLNASKGSGSSLPTATREQMENSFGANFSNVRIHNDSSAVQMSKDLNAQAFTHGSDIYFNSGKYDMNSKGGKHLLAHELTHVVQQKGEVNKKGIQRSWNWSGAGIGALFGGAAGAMIGGLAGGAGGALIGAGAGALIGGVAGGLIGGAVSTKTVTINTTILNGATDNSDRDIRTSNNIFTRNSCNVKLAKGNNKTLNPTQTSAILGSNNLLEEPSGNTASTEEQSLTALNRAPNMLTAYYVPGFNPSKRGTSLQQPSHGVPDSLLMAAGAAIDTYTHELCHILTRGRGHSTDPDNLMASGNIRNVGVDNLTSDQCNSVLTTTGYPQ